MLNKLIWFISILVIGSRQCTIFPELACGKTPLTVGANLRMAVSFLVLYTVSLTSFLVSLISSMTSNIANLQHQTGSSLKVMESMKYSVGYTISLNRVQACLSSCFLGCSSISANFPQKDSMFPWTDSIWYCNCAIEASLESSTSLRFWIKKLHEAKFISFGEVESQAFLNLAGERIPGLFPYGLEPSKQFRNFKIQLPRQ